MEEGQMWAGIIAGVGGLITGLISIYVTMRRNPHEIKKLDAEARKAAAETDNIHAATADRWAEHVDELMKKVRKLEDLREKDTKEMAGLLNDIAQVRRENERYRSENSDLRDWAERLLKQFSKHAPDVEPEKFIRRRLLDTE